MLCVTEILFISGYSRPFVRCGKQGYLMPGAFKKHAEHIYNFQVRPDDVWVVSFPRSGQNYFQKALFELKIIRPNSKNKNTTFEISTKVAYGF